MSRELQKVAHLHNNGYRSTSADLNVRCRVALFFFERRVSGHGDEYVTAREIASILSCDLHRVKVACYTLLRHDCLLHELRPGKEPHFCARKCIGQFLVTNSRAPIPYSKGVPAQMERAGEPGDGRSTTQAEVLSRDEIEATDAEIMRHNIEQLRIVMAEITEEVTDAIAFIDAHRPDRARRRLEIIHQLCDGKA